MLRVGIDHDNTAADTMLRILTYFVKKHGAARKLVVPLSVGGGELEYGGWELSRYLDFPIGYSDEVIKNIIFKEETKEIFGTPLEWMPEIGLTDFLHWLEDNDIGIEVVTANPHPVGVINWWEHWYPQFFSSISFKFGWQKESGSYQILLDDDIRFIRRLGGTGKIPILMLKEYNRQYDDAQYKATDFAQASGIIRKVARVWGFHLQSPLQ